MLRLLKSGFVDFIGVEILENLWIRSVNVSESIDLDVTYLLLDLE